MKLQHLMEQPNFEEDGYGYKNPSDNSFMRTQPDNVRKPKFTLRRLNRLKKLKATKELEQLKREDLLTMMYGQGGGEDDKMNF